MLADAKRQPGNPSVGVAPESDRKTKRLCFTVELAETKARRRRGGPPRGIDADALHWRQIDHEAAGTDGFAGIVMAAPANGYEKVVFARKAHAVDNISRSATARDQCRTLVDHAVPRLVKYPYLSADGRLSSGGLIWRDHTAV